MQAAIILIIMETFFVMMKITTKLVYLMVVTVVIGRLNGMYGTFALNEELFTTIRNFRKHQSFACKQKI